MTRDPKEMTKAEWLTPKLKEWAEKHGVKLVGSKEDPTGEYDLGQLGRFPNERVNWWEPPWERRDTIYYWDGEPWITFYWASIEIKRELGLSEGVAQRTLRELCAKGDIRSMRYEVGLIGGEYGPLHPIKPIKPREWLKDELDLDLEWTSDGDEEVGPEGYCVEVSVEDFVHWLVKQPKPERKAKAAPSEKGKRPKIKRLLAEMYPNGVPDPAHCPRKALKADLLKRDKSLDPLDEATLKGAIEEYNSDPKRSEPIRTRTHSD